MGQCMIVRRGGIGVGEDSGLPEFVYTGNSQLVDDGDGNWRIKFLTSGILTMNRSKRIDVFLVGGGGGGVNGGGGGGYTITRGPINCAKGMQYQITVGAGGSPQNQGGDTSAFDATAPGGMPAAPSNGNGGDGGSGGAGGVNNAWGPAAGRAGSDGSDGSSSGSSAAGLKGGKGQGSTTREFGDPTGDLYSGGGGAQSGGDSVTGCIAGGDGGGGNGGLNAGDATPGKVNTGGGGGGNLYTGAAGGSGIVIIRNAR